MVNKQTKCMDVVRYKQWGSTWNGIDVIYIYDCIGIVEWAWLHSIFKVCLPVWTRFLAFRQCPQSCWHSFAVQIKILALAFLAWMYHHLGHLIRLYSGFTHVTLSRNVNGKHTFPRVSSSCSIRILKWNP